MCLAFNVLAEGRMVAVSGLFQHMDSAGKAYALELTQYRNQPKAWEALQAAYMEYLATIKTAQPFADVLGPLYDAYLGKRHGQFLTPPHLANAVARFVESTAERKRVSDFTCGGGALVLGHLRESLATSGRADVLRLDIRASDIDPHMCRLTAVQVVMGSIVHGLPFGSLHVQCGDAIRDYEALQAGHNTVIRLEGATA